MSTSAVKPMKPWAATPRDRAMTMTSVLLAALTTFAIVAGTPMKGKIAYFFVFFITWLVIDSFFVLRKAGAKGVRNGLAEKLAFLGALMVMMAVASILWSVISRGVDGLNFNYFTETMRNASMFDPIGNGGIAHAIFGTVLLIIIAIFFSVPMGILTALYLTEIKGKAAGTVRFFVQAMSGIPSIVAGLFIYAVWMIALGNQYSAFAGAMALAILMIPTVARTSEEVLKLIPSDLREAGLAMGGTQWRTVAMVVIPAAQSGLITAVILGVARVAGETAPLLLTMGGADALNLNPIDGNSSAIPFYVWKNFLLGSETAIDRAWAGVLVLMIIVLFFFALTRFLSGRKGRF
jgi:phosphate transport system permease protein